MTTLGQSIVLGVLKSQCIFLKKFLASLELKNNSPFERAKCIVAPRRMPRADATELALSPLQAAGYGSERYLQPKSLQPPDIVALSHRHQPADLMDINSASTEQLKSLPGIAAPLCLFRHVTPLYNPAVQAASHVIVLQPIRFLCSQSRLAMPSDCTIATIRFSTPSPVSNQLAAE